MSGATFSLPTAYTAASAVVSDGVMVLASPYLLSSATAAFTVLDEGKPITVAGAGLAAADLVTSIKTVLSATKAILNDPALTAVNSADLTYAVGVYKLRNLMRQGDVDGNVYDVLYGRRVQIQVNSASPGKVYIGGPNVTPTNAGAELIAPGTLDNDNSGRSFDDYVCCDVDSSLINIEWAQG